jgi:hypothetical protein
VTTEHSPEALSVPDEARAQYEADLAVWRGMVARWPVRNGFTWRDEQSFKRGWLVAREARLTADRETLIRALWELEAGTQTDEGWSILREASELRHFVNRADYVLAVFESREPLTAQRERVAQTVLHTMLHSENQPNSGALSLEITDALFSEGVFTESRESTAELQAQALDDLATTVEPGADVDPETVTTIYDPYDVADMARARAAALRAGGEQS